MEQLVSLSVAEWFNKNGILIDSKYCYCIAKYGVKTVKSDNLGNNIAERTYHRGTIELIDEDWGIIAPSENWCFAPNIFEAIRYLDECVNIVITPIYKGNRIFEFTIHKNNNLIYTSNNIQYYSILSTYKNAIDYLIKELI